MKEQWLVFIPAGRWQKKTIIQAKTMGYRTMGFDEDRNADGSQLCDDFLPISLIDIKGIIRHIQRRNLNVVGALSIASEVGVMPCALIRAHFNLPGLQPSEAPLFLEKHLQRAVWDDNSVPNPEWYTNTRADANTQNRKIVEFPVLVKPSDSSGSRGISVVQTENQLDEAIDKALKFSKNGIVLIEEFLNGIEFTVEIFATEENIEVLLITQKEKVNGTNQTVASCLFTPNLDSATRHLIESTAVRAFSALNFKYGPGHAEVFLLEDGTIRMIELAARGGGFGIFNTMIEKATGFDVIGETIRSEVQSRETYPKEPKLNNSAILDFISSRKGIVRKISVDKEWMNSNNVEVEIFANVGDLLKKPSTDADRICSILVSEPNLKLAKMLLGEARKRIQLEVQ